MTDIPHALTCPACRTIDRADGVEDGNLYASIQKKVIHERVLIALLHKTGDRIADGITRFAGSMNFVYLHTIWFGIWVLINLGLIGASLEFDKFPFGLLTMVVSLEAIFLSTFVMISQNRQADRADVRAQLDFETNIRSEIWSVHIGEKLGIDSEHVEQVVRQAIEGSRAGLTTSS